MRSASECVRRSHRQCLRRPTHSEAERTCRAVGPTQFTPPHQTRQDGPVSCLVCRCESDDRVRTSNSLLETVLSCRESNSHRRSGRDADKTVLLCLAWLYKYGSVGSMCAYTHSERHLDRFSRFSTAHARDKQTHGQTHRQTDRSNYNGNNSPHLMLRMAMRPSN